MGTWLKCLYTIVRIFTLPVILVVLFFAPYCRKSKFWQSPVNKFISSTASYFVFLLFVFLQSSADKTGQLRGPPNTGIQNNYLTSTYRTKSNTVPLRLLTPGMLLQCTSGFCSSTSLRISGR